MVYPPLSTDNSFQILPYLSGIQVTESENHPAFRARVKGWKGDIGGNFSTYRKSASVSNDVQTLALRRKEVPWQSWSPELFGSYRGPILPLAPSEMSWPTLTISSDKELARLGNQAIARCAPSNPAADVTVLLGEIIKDGIPAAIGGALRSWKGQSARDRRKSIGKEHLNYEFGWKPLMNDLKKVAESIRKADAIWQQYLRDSGKMVRRRYVFPDEEASSFTRVVSNTNPWRNPSDSHFDLRDTNGNPIPMSLMDNGVVLSTTFSRKTWFSGAFSYYVPRDNRIESQIAREVIQAKKLLGLTLTPDTVWSLMPWSWAIDWFSNVGDSLESWSNWAIDGQVLLYGYIMQHTVARNTYTWVGKSGWNPDRPPTSVTLTVESKIRRKATPYGFGISWDSLSPRQIAIALSLGLTKS